LKLLYLGDLVGRSGRQAAIDALPDLREKLDLDFVIVNGENAASGFGITSKIASRLFDAGSDVVVLGNHAWDNKEVLPYADSEKRLLRPLNFPASNPGRGAGVYASRNGKRVLVLQVQGRIFMEPMDDPFAAVSRELEKYRLGADLDCIFVDIHAEATSEKAALGHFLDGKVTCVFGTHTHVPTADHQILPGGTAYMSDVGMCGDYDSVIGMQKDEPIRRFTKKIPGDRFSPALGEATICGVYLETDDSTGLAARIEPLRQGGRLTQVWPV
jgi:metallophosphoesterase (TIGR00282 family)